MDEPNSALDAISDYEISQLYQKLFQDKMGIIIAHKFNNLINQVNNILVIENGRLAESGTHTELLHQGKIYYEMYQLQNKNSAVLWAKLIPKVNGGPAGESAGPPSLYWSKAGLV